MNNKVFRPISLALFSLVFLLASVSSLFGAATIVIQNIDLAGVGFNDTTVVAPVGGNTGTTLGQQRLNAFQAAANTWGAALTSSVTITVKAQWTALPCTSNSAVLGSAGANSINRDFSGAPFSGTWYGDALANKLNGSDLNGAANAEINANFNVNLGQANCLNGRFFYLGLDNNHGNNFDLVTVLEHEFAHGLGFQTSTSDSTGAPQSGFFSAYDHFLMDDTTGLSWLQMTNAERAASALNTNNLAWTGPKVSTDSPSVLTSGNDSLGKALVFTPNPFQSGSSVSHWTTTALQNQLMEPVINSDLTHSVTAPTDLTFDQLSDVGWIASSVPSSIGKTAGDSQSAALNAAFATPLSVTVSPIVSGITVTWTAPASGASGTFSTTGTRTATSATNALGVATAPTFTANGTVGTYSINATAPGAGSTTVAGTYSPFSLTNIAAPTPTPIPSPTPTPASGSFVLDMDITPAGGGTASGNGVLKGSNLHLDVLGQTRTEVTFGGIVHNWSWAATINNPSKNVLSRVETGGDTQLGVNFVWDRVHDTYKLSTEFLVHYDSQFANGQTESGAVEYFVRLTGDVQKSNRTVNFGSSSQVIDLTDYTETFSTSQDFAAEIDWLRVLGYTYEQYTVKAIAIPPGDPSAIYLSVGDPHSGTAMFVKSTDGGQSFTGLQTMGAFSEVGVTDGLVVSPSDPQVLYYLTKSLGITPLGNVYKSTDGGDTWSVVFHNPNIEPLNQLVLDPLNPNIVYVSIGAPGQCNPECPLGVGTVLKSIDGGTTWNSAAGFSVNNKVSNFASVGGLAVSRLNSNTIYAGGHNYNVAFVSRDGGISWDGMAEPFYPENFEVDPRANTNIIYSGIGAGGIAKFVNEVPTYIGGNSGFGVKLNPYNSTSLYDIYNFGVERSLDSGATFEQISKGLETGYESSYLTLSFNPGQSKLYLGAANGTRQTGLFVYDLNATLSNVDVSGPQFRPQQQFGAAGGSGTVSFDLASGESGVWRATSLSNWITFDSPASGSGSGSVHYIIARNDGEARSGLFQIGDRDFNITQSAGIPSAPVANAGSSISVSGFTANWSSSSGAPTYRLDVSPSAAFDTFLTGFQDLNVGKALLQSVTGLAPGKTYFYRVRAVNSAGTSSNSNAITLTTALNAPIASTATGITSSGLTANWNASPGAAGYKLDLSTNNSFSSFVSGYQDVDAGNVLSLNLVGLNPSTTYFYRVRAYSGTSTSVNSNSISAVTTVATPSAPTANAATNVTVNSFTANWSSSIGATSYRLDISTNAAFSSFVTGFQDLTVASVARNVTGLTPGTTYFYRVRAVNAGGTSGNSNSITVNTTLAVPVGAAATGINGGGFTANWAASTGATGYRLDVSPNSAFSSFLAGYQDLDVGNFLNVNVAGLNPTTNYFYRVRAYNANFTTANSNTIGVTTTVNTPAVPVANAATGISTNSFTANWSSSTSATGYKLDVSTSNTFSTFVAGFQDLTVSTVSRSVTGLAAGTNYFFRVRAFNAAGTSGSSNTIAVLTIPNSPAATPASNITNSSFTANWNSSTGAMGYRLDVSTSSTFSTFVSGFQNLDVGNVLSQSISGLNASTSYFYRIRTYTVDNTSINSNLVVVTTLVNAPATPVASAATSVTVSGFTANWAASTGATSYRLDISTDAAFSSFVTGFEDLTVAIASRSVTGLSPGASYYYRVRAVNAGGTSLSSNTVTATTAIAAPIASAASNTTSSGFIMNWAASSGAIGYRLDVSTSSTFATFINGFNNLDVGNVLSLNIGSLNGSTNYFYRVRAYTTVALSGNSNTITVTTLVSAPIAPVANAATGITLSSFQANWSTSSGATSYRLDVSTDSLFTSFVTGFHDLNVGNVLTRNITGLISGSEYFYRVRAVNAGGTSVNSNNINVITNFAIPSSPTGTNVTEVNGRGFTANWNGVSGASGYRLDVSTSNTFSTFVPGFQNLDVGNVLNWTVTGLNAGTNYFYRIRSYNPGGTSGNSSTFNVTTPASREGNINRIDPMIPDSFDNVVDLKDSQWFDNFINGSYTPASGGASVPLLIGPSAGENQTRDLAPLATSGDGCLNAQDRQQLILIVLGLGTTPGLSGGPSVLNLCPPVRPEDVRRSEMANGSALVDMSVTRSLRVVSANSIKAGYVNIEIDIDAVGNEAQAKFTLEFDPTTIAIDSTCFPSVNADINVGDDAPSGSTVAVNASAAATGRITVMIDFHGAVTSGLGKRLVNLTFHRGSKIGERRPIFKLRSDEGQIVDGAGNELETIYQSGNKAISPVSDSSYLPLSRYFLTNSGPVDLLNMRKWFRPLLLGDHS